MGSSWGWSDKNDLVKDQLSNWQTGILIDFKLVGSNLWQLVETRKGKMIALSKILYDRKSQEYGVKDLDETMGIYENNCPKSLVKQCDEPINDYSKEWREKVLNRKSVKRARLEIGSKIEILGTHYTVIEDIGRRGYIVTFGFSRYRLSNQQANRALFK